MRKIIVTTFVSLDGVLQAPGGPDEDPTHGFKWGGWTATQGDALTNQAMVDIMAQPFDLLLGRRTYEIFAAYWPYAKGHPIGEVFDRAHKYAVSSKSVKLSWANSTLITGDVVAGLRKLKASEGPDLLVYGSGKLIQTLLKEGLVDKLYTWVYPVTLGEGKRLFAEGTQPAQWKLLHSVISTTGVIIATYEPAGELKTGLIGPDNPSEAELKRRKEWKKEG
ncbi:dihydrofolate reductase family protein [Chitinophaga sp.]|uniref:dihydrofolate reductase family protein n=1 Tax=Chitinophaga sp. TaxID=1869181 RepID=UPI002F95C282